MFDLEKEISAWRQQMSASGINASEHLDELESHLREEAECQRRSGADEALAFETAVVQIGQPNSLQKEFQKNKAEGWNVPLFWTAWVLFVVSMFLPAYDIDRGWKCALVSATIIGQCQNWSDVHLAAQVLPNLFMLVMPLCWWRYSHLERVAIWLRRCAFVSLVLVWSFLLSLLLPGGGSILRVGAYAWAGSFLLLCLSLKPRHGWIKKERRQLG